MRSLRDHLLRGGRHERIPTNEEPEHEHQMSIPLGNNIHRPTSPSDPNGNTANDPNNTQTSDEEQNVSSTHDSSPGMTPEEVSSSSNTQENTTHDSNQGIPHHHNDDDVPHILSAEMSELLVELEQYRKRTTIWFFFQSFFLLRLWISAFDDDVDPILVVFASLLTVYLIAWRLGRAFGAYDIHARISAQQGREHALREESDEHENEMSSRERGSRRERRRRRIRMEDVDHWDLSFSRNRDHIDLGMLSFQAQMAIAIMESQRHIIETGGYGRPEGDEEEQKGVSVETKKKWETFEYDINHPKVKECPDLKPDKLEEPSCCICLCEYEKGEALYQLNCGHVYHKECIDGWCESHTRCPLCNFELEEEDTQEEDAGEIV